MENTNKKVSNVKMYDDNITTYISNLSSIAREKTDDIQKDISNITYACLGFFLVINEHFTPLKNSSYRLFLYISVFLFILSIFYSLFYKNRLSSYCREIVTFALSERKKIFNDPKNVSLDDINNFYDRIEEKTDLNNYAATQSSTTFLKELR